MRSAGGSRSPCETAQPIGSRLAGSTSSGPTETFISRPTNRLSPYSLTGQWPETGKGNRQGKGPFRYLGRFFYTTGETEVVVPAGRVRIEVWKGFEYQPLVRNVMVAAGETVPVSLELERATPMAAMGYYSGDLHLHFPAQGPKPTIRRSSTCSKPRISSSARSWPTTSRPARTPG